MTSTFDNILLMGNLSEHFSTSDFSCKCGKCGRMTRVHLGLVGALEAVASYFRRTPRIHEAYRCDILSAQLNMLKKNPHRLGKAAHISVDGVSQKELFDFVRTLPEIRGLGVHPQEKRLHIDTRSLDKDDQREEWVKDGDKTMPMTKELLAKLGLS